MTSTPDDHNCSLEPILNAVKLGLILIDSTGKVALWNEWIAERSGIPSASAIGHSLDSLFPDGLSAPFKTALNNALTRKLPIVLSNALHRSPLPLYPLPAARQPQERIQQSITITPVTARGDGAHLCLIQVTDASMSIKRERVLKSHSEQLSLEATTDGLTGAYNRRYFDERHKAEFGRALRQNSPLSLIMLDIDFFKAYNDSYGHPAGDKVLIAVVNALQAQLNRSTDVVTRYGGEEFAILLPDCDRQGSQTVAEKLRAAVAGLNIAHRASQAANHVTTSIGVATYLPGIHCNAACFLETADTALYNAKHEGRNRVRHLLTPECQKACPTGALPFELPG